MEDTLYKLDISFPPECQSLRQTFQQTGSIIDLQNMFTAFAVGLSGYKLNSKYYARKFFYHCRRFLGT